MQQSARNQRMRQRIAEESARIMTEEGVNNFLLAKRKAAARLGAANTRNMPRNHEIEQALVAYQRLFRADTQPAHLQTLRHTAIQAMRLLERFEPRLVGPVLSGTAGANAGVELHLFAESPEEVAFFLTDHQIPFVASTDRVRAADGTYQDLPGFRFVAGDTQIVITVFRRDGMRVAPLSPVDGKPMQRAPLKRVESLLHASAEDGSG